MKQVVDLISVEVFIDGKQCKEDIIKLEVDRKLNKIASAVIVIDDGDKAQESFLFADSGKVNPGKKIEVKAGYHSKTTTIFKGMIMSTTTQIDADEGSFIVLKCKDEVVKMTLGKKNAYFLNMKDSDIIKKIVSTYTSSASVDTTDVKYEEIIQYGATDWDFIVSRAEINGFVVLTDNGKLSIKKPLLSDNTDVTLKYGDSIIDMNLSVNSSKQLEDVTSYSWDSNTQSVVQNKSKEPNVNKEGNQNSKVLAQVMQAKANLQTVMPLNKDALKSWSDAQLLKSRLARITGTITCNGNASIQPNTLIELKSVGKLLNGDAYVSGVYHELSEGTWTTECTIGLEATWFAETYPISSLPNSGRLPAINGLQIGIVKKIHEDPNGESRVQVTLPLITDSEEGIWARLSTFYASNTFGAFFYPEVGDEVILGFLDDNPSAPIILGSVYSKKMPPAQTPNETNSNKTLTTKSKMVIDFNDDDKVITIKTPNENKIVISDDDKGITILDQTKNKIEMNDSGITIESKKAMTIKVADKLEISAKEIDIKADTKINVKGTDIMVKASNGLNLEGTNTTVKANASLSAQGQASAEFKASGNTTIKGAIVNIN